jgi:hypothetical protein
MNERRLLTRRTTLGSLAASPLLVTTNLVAATLPADAHLLALGRDFNVAAAKLDYTIATGMDLDDGLLEQLDRLDAEIATTQASTMEGFCVKARAACWALLGDLDDSGNATTDRRMALSIVRDLIRLYDPGLERPGALKQLVQDIESGAG